MCSGTRSTCLEFVPNRIETLVVKSKKSIERVVKIRDRRTPFLLILQPSPGGFKRIYTPLLKGIYKIIVARENEIFPANNGFGPIP